MPSFSCIYCKSVNDRIFVSFTVRQSILDHHILETLSQPSHHRSISIEQVHMIIGMIITVPCERPNEIRKRRRTVERVNESSSPQPLPRDIIPRLPRRTKDAPPKLPVRSTKSLDGDTPKRTKASRHVQSSFGFARVVLEEHIRITSAASVAARTA